MPLVVDPNDDGAHVQLAAFLRPLPTGSALNVAGPREREEPGVYTAARALLEAHAAELLGS